MLPPRLFGERDDPTLARGIHGLTRRTHPPGIRRHVHHAVKPTIGHAAHHDNRRVPSRDIRQAVRPPERRRGGSDLFAIGDIDAICLCLRALCCRFPRARLIEIENPQHAAFRGQAQRGGAADAARTTGQDHPPSGKSPHVQAE
jgi:hypothetical protein